MKQNKKVTGIILQIAILGFALSGCGAVKKVAELPPEIVFSYPSDVPVVRDQDKVCTVFIGANISLEVDGVMTVYVSGKANKSLRIANKGLIRQRVVDILPGKHTVELNYMSVDDFGGQRTVRKLTEPIVMDFEFTAGCYYQIIPNAYHGLLLVHTQPDVSVRNKINEVRSHAAFD